MFGLISRLRGDMSAAEAVSGAAAGRVTLLDVRETGELKATGKALGALHIPLARLEQSAASPVGTSAPGLTTDACIAVYCASGARSMAAQRVLRQLGYTDVHNIGGLSAWVRSGGVTEPA